MGLWRTCSNEMKEKEHQIKNHNSTTIKNSFSDSKTRLPDLCRSNILDCTSHYVARGPIEIRQLYLKQEKRFGLVCW